MFDRISIYIVSALLMLGSFAVEAGKIYKWTDDEGNVHFGQKAPGGGKKVESIKGSSSTLSPQQRSGSLYCGELRVSYKRYKNTKQSTQGIESSLKSWRKSLRRSQRSLKDYQRRIGKMNPNKRHSYSRSQSSDFYERNNKLNKSVAEYSCAVAWGEDKLLSLKVDSTVEADNYKLAKKDLEAAQVQQLKICGAEPPSYNTYGNERDTYRSWKRCQRKNGSVVRKMERRVKSAKKELNRVK